MRLFWLVPCLLLCLLLPARCAPAEIDCPVCSKDGDCLAPLKCFEGFCRQSAEVRCKTGRRCTEDTACGAGEICHQEVCTKGCRKDDDCDGLECINQSCGKRICLAGSQRLCEGDSCKGKRQFCQFAGLSWSACQGASQKEVCDGVDNDCNGKIDDNVDCQCAQPGSKRSCYPGDAKEVGNGQCESGTQYCGADKRWGPCFGAVAPTLEVCDGVDNDCDGKTDEDLQCTCTPGRSRPCFTGLVSQLDVGICRRGAQVCTSKGVWGKCFGQQLPEPDLCDGRDNDCDGTIDKGCPGPEPIPEPPPQEPAAEPQPEPRTEPQAEPQAEPRPEPKAEPRPEPQAEPRQEPAKEATADAGTSEPRPERGPDAGPSEGPPEKSPERARESGAD